MDDYSITDTFDTELFNTNTIYYFLPYAILMVILFIIYYSRPDYLKGFWRASEEFCDEAGVDSIMLYISEPGGMLGRARAGYIIMGPDLGHQGFDLNVGVNRSISPYSCKCSVGVTFDDDPLWDDKVSITSDGSTLKILSGGKLAFYGHRDF